jgi:hypothetical protein
MLDPVSLGILFGGALVLEGLKAWQTHNLAEMEQNHDIEMSQQQNRADAYARAYESGRDRFDTGYAVAAVSTDAVTNAANRQYVPPSVQV